MKVGDLVCGNFNTWDEHCYGIVLASKEKEYFYIKWLDSGEEICYSYPYRELMNYLEVISESR